MESIAPIDFLDQFGIDDVPVVIFPYLPLLIILTIKTPAGNGAVFTYRTSAGLTIKTNTVSIGIMRNEIRSAELPADDTLLHILPGQREREFAAYRPADWQFALAIHVGFVFESVLVVFRVLVQKPDAAFNELL